jgi:predicted ATPase
LYGSSVRWLTAVRVQPPRLFTLEPGGSAEISPDGAGTAEALWISALREDSVADAVSNWLKSACGCELAFAATDAQVALGKRWYPFQVKVGSAAVAVADVGEGVSQALPVVTLCRQAVAGLLGEQPLLTLEQPELHLHPRAAAALAQEIVACVAEGSPAAHVIETHSEHFLLALQVALLEKKLTKDHLLVYWVEHDGQGAQLRRIEFDDEGYPSVGWPEGVFREALEQARRVSELRVGG